MYACILYINYLIWFIDYFSTKTSIYRGFQIATFDSGRVFRFVYVPSMDKQWRPLLIHAWHHHFCQRLSSNEAAISGKVANGKMGKSLGVLPLGDQKGMKPASRNRVYNSYKSEL
jgi:hypothetical protein